MTRLYADTHFPLQVVEALRDLGHDVLTVLEAGQANQRITDLEILAFAVGTDPSRWSVVRRRSSSLARHPSAIGSRIVNVLPWFSALRTSTVPPWRLTISLTTNRPIPIPPMFEPVILPAR